MPDASVHPWLEEVWVVSDPFEREARDRISWAVSILGFDHVNGRAFERTRLPHVDANDPRELALFAEWIGGEAEAGIAQQRRGQEAERLERARLAGLARRDAGTALLLGDD